MTTTIQQVFDELKRIEEKMVTKEDMEALVDTIEIMSNPETMRKLEESNRDIKEGRVKEITCVQDMLDEL